MVLILYSHQTNIGYIIKKIVKKKQEGHFVSSYSNFA